MSDDEDLHVNEPYPILRGRLLRFYEVYRPEKMDDIDTILESFEDRIDELFYALKDKYDVPVRQLTEEEKDIYVIPFLKTMKMQYDEGVNVGNVDPFVESIVKSECYEQMMKNVKLDSEAQKQPPPAADAKAHAKPPTPTLSGAQKQPPPAQPATPTPAEAQKQPPPAADAKKAPAKPPTPTPAGAQKQPPPAPDAKKAPAKPATPTPAGAQKQPPAADAKKAPAKPPTPTPAEAQKQPPAADAKVPAKLHKPEPHPTAPSKSPGKKLVLLKMIRQHQEENPDHYPEPENEDKGQTEIRKSMSKSPPKQSLEKTQSQHHDRREHSSSNQQQSSRRPSLENTQSQHHDRREHSSSNQQQSSRRQSLEKTQSQHHDQREHSSSNQQQSPRRQSLENTQSQHHDRREHSSSNQQEHIPQDLRQSSLSNIDNQQKRTELGNGNQQAEPIMNSSPPQQYNQDPYQQAQAGNQSYYHQQHPGYHQQAQTGTSYYPQQYNQDPYQQAQAGNQSYYQQQHPGYHQQVPVTIPPYSPQQLHQDPYLQTSPAMAQQQHQGYYHHQQVPQGPYSPQQYHQDLYQRTASGMAPYNQQHPGYHQQAHAAIPPYIPQQHQHQQHQEASAANLSYNQQQTESYQRTSSTNPPYRPHQGFYQQVEIPSYGTQQQYAMPSQHQINLQQHLNEAPSMLPQLDIYNQEIPLAYNREAPRYSSPNQSYRQNVDGLISSANGKQSIPSLQNVTSRGNSPRIMGYARSPSPRSNSQNRLDVLNRIENLKTDIVTHNQNSALTLHSSSKSDPFHSSTKKMENILVAMKSEDNRLQTETNSTSNQCNQIASKIVSLAVQLQYLVVEEREKIQVERDTFRRERYELLDDAKGIDSSNGMNISTGQQRSQVGLGMNNHITGQIHTVKLASIPGEAGMYSSISLALKACKDGDTIHIHPGRYFEMVSIEDLKGIKIMGIGRTCEQVILSSDASCVVRTCGSDVNFSNLSFLLWEDSTAVVATDGSEVRLSEVDIQGGGVGVTASTRTKIWVSHCHIKECMHVGVAGTEGCQVTVEDTYIGSCGNSIVVSGTTLHVSNCEITRATNDGIFMANASRGIIENCKISENSENGITLDPGVEVMISRNTIEKNCLYGVNAAAKSKYTLLSNEIRSNMVETQTDGIPPLAPSKMLGHIPEKSFNY